jgi:ubiquinone/menaquinone biosynthesis C-methylase UbiE
MSFHSLRVPEGGAIHDEPQMRAEDYGEFMRSRLEGEYRRFAAQAIAFSSLPEGAKVREIGPGPGWAGIMLLEQRPDLRLEGLDASRDMVRAASANAAKAGFAESAGYRFGAAETLEGVPDSSVDLIISRDSLHHWDDPRAAFESILRVLKTEGKLYLADERRDLSLAAWGFVYAFGTITMGGMARFWRSSIRAAYSPEELRAMLPKATGREWRVEGGFLDLQVMLAPSGARCLTLDSPER